MGWDELKGTLGQVIEIACCFDADGIDVYFLNRGEIKNVRSGKDERLERAFAARPSGGTPLGRTIQAVLQEKQGNDKPLLVLVATDGVPNEGVRAVARIIRQSISDSRSRVRYQLLACSDRDRDIGWMNELDDEFGEVDCTDDYQSERNEVLAAGVVKHFERGDWVMKALLGPVSKKFDAWDESLSSRGATKRSAAE